MRLRLLPLAILMLVAAGCHTDMWVQPKVKAQHESEVFADGMGSRPKVPGSVARGQNVDDPAYATGFDPATKKLVTQIPWERAAKELKLDSYKELLMHGKERFEIFCTPCHGQLGNGQGMIAKRGLKIRRQPGNYHTPRLQKMPDGHFFDVMTNGYGVMYSFASRIPVEDRWAIVSYIRALQRSQNPQGTETNGAR